MSETEITRFTDDFSLAIERLFRVGGFALAFGFAGIILMMGAHFFGGSYTLWLIILGAILTFVCLIFFFYTSIKGRSEVAKSIKDNKEAIDAVQDISLQLTQLTSTVQSYSFKNLDRINETLNIVLPKLQAIPIIGDKVEHYGLQDISASISSFVVENSEKTERLVADIENALVNADHEKLQAYSNELALLVSKMKTELKK